MDTWIQTHRRQLTVIIGALCGLTFGMSSLFLRIRSEHEYSSICNVLSLILIPLGFYVGGAFGKKIGDAFWWSIEGRSFIWLRYVLLTIVVAIGSMFSTLLIFVFVIY